MKETAFIDGFKWNLEVVNCDGTIAASETVHNLIPLAALNHLIRAPFGDTPPVSDFYLGLFRGNYIPSDLATAADIPTAIDEFVDYEESTRPLWDKQLQADNSYDNLDRKAEFTITQDRTIYGALLCSSPVKGGNEGLLLSVVRFSSPRPVTAGQTVRLSGGLTYRSRALI